MSSRRSPGQRAGLTQNALLMASWELLTSVGVEALTMRALAHRLGVAPNALYSHVATKSALLDLLLDDLLAQVPAPLNTNDPVAGLTELMTATYQTLITHPDLVRLYLVRQGARGPHALRLGEIMDDLLTRAGVDPAGVAPTRRALIIHTIGSAAFVTAAEPEHDRQLTLEQSRSTFEHSLRWLLAGATQQANQDR